MDLNGEDPLTILFEDDHLVAVDKPEGLLVHRSHIDRHETTFLLQRLRDQIGQRIYPVQRLDKPTSGVIVFAKHSTVAAALQQQINHTDSEVGARKTYLLVCRGFPLESGRIDHALKPINDFKGRPVKTEPQAKSAITDFQRLHTIELPVTVDKYPQSRYALVQARLLTGRKHQLRRHFKHISHPIIGCPKYGKSSHNRYFADQLGVARLLLHSYELCLTHPVTAAALRIQAPPSGSFAQLLQIFQWPLAVSVPT